MVKILPLGGMGNVTKNMFAYDDGAHILLVDCGIGFPDENMPGVDLLIPDWSWLLDKKDRIIGMFLTHGHDDHIAGLPYLLPQIGENFPIFASPLTAAFAESRLREIGVNKKILILQDKPIVVGKFTVHGIRMTHSIPDTRHLVIESGNSRIYHGSDFKIDLTPVDNVRPDLVKIASFGQKGISLLLSDCLRSEKPGYSLSESSLESEFEQEIRGTRGKFIVTTMSSNVHRIQQAINVAANHNRQIAFIGRSIEQNIKDAQQLGLIKLPRKMVVNKRDIHRIPPKNLCLIIAGSQGQPGSSLVRAATATHDLVQLSTGDKVVFSSDPIPGNEAAVYETVDSLSRLGADVAYSDVNDTLHVSGHASAGEIKLLMQLTQAKYLMPIGGTYRHMIQYQKLASEMGYPDKQLFLLDSGQTIILADDGSARLGETISLKNIMVDGLGIGDVGKVVLRDRQTMAEDGILVVIMPLDRETGKLAGRIEVISRGFVYMKESKDLIDGVVDQVTQTLNRIPQAHDWGATKDTVANSLQGFIWSKTQRSPMVLPVIIEV